MTEPSTPADGAADPNADQIAFWNGPAGQKWVDAQERMDRTLAPIGARAMAVGEIAAGHRVLDVGCGCGGTTLEIAERVGGDGLAHGIDISEVMLARAKARAADLAHLPAKFDLIDPQAAAPAGPYERVFSRFGVMFFARPDVAFDNLRRCLVPGGKIGFVAWRTPGENPWVMVPVKAVAGLVEMPPRPGPEDPGEFSFGAKDRILRIMTDAGFANIEIEAWDPAITTAAGGDLPMAVDATMNMGPLSRALAEVDDNIRAEVADRLTAALAQHQAAGGGVEMQAGVWLVSASRTD